MCSCQNLWSFAPFMWPTMAEYVVNVLVPPTAICLLLGDGFSILFQCLSHPCSMWQTDSEVIDPRWSWSPVCVLYNTFLLSVCGGTWLASNQLNIAKVMDVTPMITLHYMRLCLTSKFIHCFDEISGHFGKVHVGLSEWWVTSRSWGHPPTISQQNLGPSVLQPQGNKFFQ